MLPFLLFISVTIAEQYYIGPTEDGSIANSAFVMLINDEADSATTSIGTCFQDKSYYFKTKMHGEQRHFRYFSK